jgi:iron complex transport system ATP-binding protein
MREPGMLRAEQVSFSYDTRPVLDGVDVSVQTGGLVGVLGPNGSGKTTFLKLLAGLLTPASGHITLDEVDITTIDRRTLARRVAVVPQETELAFDYSVLEIVLMGRYPHLQTFELEGPADLAIARRTLAATGTAHLEQRTFRTLSGGEKQRIVMASALAQFEGAPSTPDRGDPPHEDTNTTRVLLLDEPTSSLDLSFQLATATLIAELNRTYRTTAVVCTHDLNFAAGLCRSLVLLRDGRVVASGPTDEVLTPATIGAVYDVEADVHRHEVTRHLTVVPLARL